MFRKIFKWFKEHKVFTIAGCTTVVAFVLTAGILAMKTKEDPLNREEWAEMFGKRFGYVECDAKDSVYSDIKRKDTVFVYAHALKEEGVYDWEGEFQKRHEVTFGEMLSHTAKAFGYTYIDSHANIKEQTEAGYKDYVRKLVALSEKYTDDQVLEDEEAAKWLEEAYVAYENRTFENKVEYTMKSGVKMMDTVTDYEFIINHEDREVLLVYTDQDIVVGDVIVLGINEDYPQGATFKVDTIVEKVACYVLEVSEAQIEDVFDNFSLEFNKEIGDVSFVPAEEVELVASENDKGNVEKTEEVLLRLNPALLEDFEVIPTFSYSKDGEFFNRSFTWSTERSGEGPLVLDADYPPVPGFSMDGTGTDTGIYSAGSFVGSDNKLHSKYSAGMEVDLGLALSDFSLSGTASYSVFSGVGMDVTTKITVNPYFAVRGNASKSIYLGSFPIPLGYGFSVQVDIYVNVSVEGEITVSPVIAATGIVRKEEESKKIKTSGSAKTDFEVAVDGAVGLSVGPDVNIAWSGLSLADAYAYVGVGASASYSKKDGNEMTVSFYMPTLVVGTGENESALLYKIIGKKEKKVIHMTDDAVFKCPYVTQYTVPLIRSSTKDLKWSVKDTVLTLSGDGWMQDYWGETGVVRPWDEYSEKIEKIVINDNVNYVGAYAFAFMPNLTEVVINSNLEKIHVGAFEGCTTLKELVLPDSLTELGDGAFAYCESLEELIIPNNITDIPENMCIGCTTLKKVVLPAKVTSIGQSAFYDCAQLEDITLPTGKFTVGLYAFDGCIKLPNL